MGYTIEELCETFDAHARKFIEDQAKLKEKYPHLEQTSDFILPRALCSICTEIKNLKDKYGTNQPEIPANMPK